MAGVLPLALNLRTVADAGLLSLEIHDGLLAKEDEKLPLARHVIRTLQHLYFV